MPMKTDAAKLKRHIKSEKGFTLVELILALAIMSILLTMFYTLFFAGGRHYEFVHDSYKMQNEARIAMSYITTKIRQNDVLFPVPGYPQQMQHAVSVGYIGTDGYLKIETIDDGGNREYEYIYEYEDPGGGVKLMSPAKPDEDLGSFDPNGSVIADSLYGIEFDLTMENGNQCINVVIEYDSTGKGEFRETIVLRAE